MTRIRWIGWFVLLVCLSLDGLSEDVVAADAARTTSAGSRFIVPDGWTVREQRGAIVVTAPERDSHIAIVETDAVDADAAMTAAWAAYDADTKRTLERSSERPTRNGWAEIRVYGYATAANERRLVYGQALRNGKRWTAMLADLSTAVAGKRDAHIGRLFNIQPHGYTPETFAGKKAHTLDAKRLAKLTDFVDRARTVFDVPGVALGLVQDGRIVFAGGFGVRELGKPEKVDADTLFHAGSVLKPMTTLLLAKLVDAGKFTWDTPVTRVMPAFALGDAATTQQVLMRHLVCACTGLPRRDYEGIFASEGNTPAKVMATLATMQPTAKFGEVYQYSNAMAAAAGFVGGHALYPERELGAAYDAAIQALVFDPLGMAATTFDFDRAERTNHAAPHARDVAGRTVRASQASNKTSIPMRPDGGAFSSVNDLLRYVRMELDEGVLPDGTRYIAKAALLERRKPQVARGGEAQSYAMGLKVDASRGTEILTHGGSMDGYQSEILWLPEHRVGIVLLTNANDGVNLRLVIPRRVLELLFDAAPEAENHVSVLAKLAKEGRDAERAALTVPADAKSVAALATRYSSAALGDIDVVRNGNTTTFDFGDWESEVATRRDDDGTTVFVTSSPSVAGFEFVVTKHKDRRALVLRDEQHEYVFEEEM